MRKKHLEAIVADEAVIQDLLRQLADENPALAARCALEDAERAEWAAEAAAVLAEQQAHRAAAQKLRGTTRWWTDALRALFDVVRPPPDCTHKDVLRALVEANAVDRPRLERALEDCGLGDVDLVVRGRGVDLMRAGRKVAVTMKMIARARS